MKNEIKLFEGKQIRTHWDEEKEEWYFSVVDIIGVLTESKDPGAYWRKLKQRLKEDGSETVTFCHALKLKASDGKMRNTDIADIRGIFRIIQSVPSPKAEPFKMWLAEVGKEWVDEIMDPELTIDRALRTYLAKGYTREWINQRLQAISVRKELTDAWQDHGVKAGSEYAILRNEITKAWSGMTTRQYKNLKGLTKESLRDNMSTTEIVLNMLAETATKEIINVKHPDGLEENIEIANEGGSVAKAAREAIESKTGKKVITSKKALDLGRVITAITEKNDDDNEK